MATYNPTNLVDTDSGKYFSNVTCGVQRKVNIGNFESVDIYCSASLPVELEDIVDIDYLEEKLTAAMEKLIHITSKETAEKYMLVKGQGH